jgi:hypothetical protein
VKRVPLGVLTVALCAGSTATASEDDPTLGDHRADLRNAFLDRVAR